MTKGVFMVRTRYSPLFIAKSAQSMRNRMTTAEGMLWKHLSNGFDGERFRRQYPIGNHVVDFYCRKMKLIVEISAAPLNVVTSQHSAPFDTIAAQSLRVRFQRWLSGLQSKLYRSHRAVESSVQKERDASPSDAYLRACGYTVLGFAEKEIITDPSRIVSVIGLRVKLIRINMRISFVKGMVRHALQTILCFSLPKRRFHAETNHGFKLLVEF
jgi:very-short-patch-repair endonuclease